MLLAAVVASAGRHKPIQSIVNSPADIWPYILAEKTDEECKKKKEISYTNSKLVGTVVHYCDKLMEERTVII